MRGGHRPAVVSQASGQPHSQCVSLWAAAGPNPFSYSLFPSYFPCVQTTKSWRSCKCGALPPHNCFSHRAFHVTPYPCSASSPLHSHSHALLSALCCRFGEALAAAALLYWFRVFERLMGSAKFAGFVFVNAVMASTLQLGLLVSFPSIERIAPGPYPLIFSLFVVYYGEKSVPLCVLRLHVSGELWKEDLRFSFAPYVCVWVFWNSCV